MYIQAPKGTQDILPGESYRWQSVEEKIRRLCALAGYREIRTPTFEHTELFQRGVGDVTDVVQKEMYTFTDKGDRSITLRPEGTAGAVRAFIEGHLYAEPMPIKMYYLSSAIFRYDKPQAGRFREHHQFGVEVFGAKDAGCDAEIIALAMDVLTACGVGGLKLMINSIGCAACRAAYLEALKAYLAPKLPSLCKTCVERYERNPMRVLDCKDDSGKLGDAPGMITYLCEDCAAHFETLKRHLGEIGFEYEVDARIVRGLDYYTKTVFEIVTETPGGMLTVCGGGRYDGLVETLGGPSTAGLGFGMGIERLVMVQDMYGAKPDEPVLYDVFVSTLGDAARTEGMKLVRELRAAGIKADIDHAARSLKAQFKYANKVGAPYVVVLAEDEMARGVVKLRGMADGNEEEIERGALVGALVKRKEESI